MSEQIKDGAGKGYLAKVDANQQIHTFSVTESEESQATENGLAYNINTGTIGLTTATESAILYVKNNEDTDLVIDLIAVGIDDEGTTAGMSQVTVIRNPTTGTIISSPTNVDMNQNRNFGSNKTLTVDAYKGAEGDTFTDGDDTILFYVQPGTRLAAPVKLELPKGSSIGIKIDSDTSAGTTNVYAALVCHLKDANNA